MTVFVALSFPTYQVEHIIKIGKAGLSLDSILVLGDGRRKFTDKARLIELNKTHVNIVSEATRCGLILQAAEAYLPNDVDGAIKYRITQNGAILTLPEYLFEELRAVLGDSFVIMNTAALAAHAKYKQLNGSDEFFQTPEYTAHEKNLRDLVTLSISMYREVTTSTEAVAKMTGGMDLAFWQHSLSLYTELCIITKKIAKIIDILRQFGMGIPYGSKTHGATANNVFEAIDGFISVQYDVERHTLNIQKKLTATYTDDPLPDNYPNLELITKKPMPIAITPRVYEADLKDSRSLVTTSVQVARAIESIRYLSEVVAFS